MPIILDVITRKKLILVRQLYQRAVLQAEAKHSYVDRIMALIGFDLTNETVLKAVVSAVDPSKTPSGDFQGIVNQADTVLTAAGLPAVPDRAKIQHVRTIRNDAQHKAKYPNDTDVSDCRTYTRDFLRQLISDVWNENFDLLSLVEVVQNTTIKGFLKEAEDELSKGNYKVAVVKCIAAMDWTFAKIRASIVGRMPTSARALLVGDGFDQAAQSTEVYQAFIRMQDIVMRSVIGLEFPGYLRFKRITSTTAVISFAAAGNYTTRYRGHEPTVQETEYVLDFATNAIIQIESLVGDIDKPFEL
jgi:hypothetical protein